jgi:uncharacterized protein DUF992
MTRLRSILLPIAAATMAFAMVGPAAAAVKVGVLHCTVSPSIGFLIGGHQKLRCHFTPQYPGQPAGDYVGAINTVGLDIGVTAGGVLAWAVFAPTEGPFAGALAGIYYGASADIAVGLGLGANVLVGGSGRTIALQPLSVEGEVAMDVTLGMSGLELRYVD